MQLGADNRTVELGMVAGLLHDVGLIKGDKADYALRSSKIFGDFIDKDDINNNVNIFAGWPKAITIPYKVSKYLNKEYVLLINGRPVDVSKFTT